MSGNTFGKIFKITTWGESHGPALGVVIDGCIPNLKLSEKDIQKELNRRKPLKGSCATTDRIEDDKPKILSGVFEGKTTGTPISILIVNKNIKSKDYSAIKDLYRPGHADMTYDLKYGIRDYRGGGRSSGRETVARVAAGTIAKILLKKTTFISHTVQIGKIKAKKFDKNFMEKNDLRCADKSAYKKMAKYVEELSKKGNGTGAIVEIIIKNPPVGLGEPVFDKLSADLAKAMLSIGAVKGIEFGAGFNVAEMTALEGNDQLSNKKFLSNNCGGILGGISTGEDITIRLAVKAPSSIKLIQKTITKTGKNATIQTHGRHDCCIAPRIIPVAESMAALVLADHLLQNKCLNSK